MFLSTNKNRKSTDLEVTQTPKLGQKQNGAKTPKSGLKMQTPKSGLKMQSPKPNLKPGTPKSNEKKKGPKNGARKSLAVNGSPKVEKATPTEEKTVVDKAETVAVKAEAGANKKNRKRSLSEAGEESATKVQKLEKFAGTASLKSNKKDKKEGEAIRSAKRHEEFKVNKKSQSKTNKLQIKTKILEGDVATIRALQVKLDALLAKPLSERSSSARRKIRKFQSWLNIKTKKGGGLNKPSAQKPANKKNQKKNQVKVEVEKPTGKKIQQTKSLEEPKSEEEHASDGSEGESDGDFEMLSAESDDVAEEGSDQDDSDVDEESDDVTSKFVVDQQGSKQNQQAKKPVQNKQGQNKGFKAFGKPGNKKFAGRQKKTTPKK